ncbi:MAG: Protein-L-isoaspartate O-methyltransferase [Alphaproteobacteria bacterium MarineAlpha5_Bin12]|nr:MAG: Protein-L-isoaspartate O-methyltransferase [Alphaproteobacteria bacterium MarineAlpha5_Bin12]|tara:strand:+ start:1042 stop:1698 length:657 start_codon:yes stop_codon:yes gene_type:complete
MNYSNARKIMVDTQIRPNNIKDDNLISLFSSIEKELFLESSHKEFAYFDSEINFGNNKSYLSNLHIAQLIQSAKISKKDHILHIGALTGYVTNFLSKLSNKVTAIENDQILFEILNKNIKNFSMNNVTIYKSELNDGFIQNSPYDLIFIDHIIDFIPNSIKKQINKSQGRLVSIERINDNLSKGFELTINNENYYKEFLFDSFSESKSIFLKKNNFVF